MTGQDDVIPVGDAAVFVVAGGADGSADMERVWSLSSLLRDALASSALDIVPSYRGVLVRFDPSAARLATVMAVARGAMAGVAAAPARTGRTIQVNVCFAGEYALDLAEVAAHAKLTPAQAIARFCEPVYRVAFLGFLAGFPYLRGLPPLLDLPRLPTPRLRVPAGSVALAAGQCGIYPRSSPGGWRIVGRTAAAVFDLNREPVTLFAPGDHVRFHAVASLDEATASVTP